jgi:tripartite-type tricarboxylate transporter receptor subunit TctC
MLWTKRALLAALVAAPFAASSAQAQNYPNQPIKFIIQAAAGGLPDTVARIVARVLQERLGQSIVVENRPGANGSVAIAAMLGAPADGYTFVVSDGSILSINPVIYSKLAYNTADILPAVMLARAPLFLAVHPKVPVATLKEFIDHAKAHPGALNYGSSGVGSTHHLSMEAVSAALSIKMTHVPFKGTGEAVPALLGGHVDLLFSAYPSLSGAIETKKVKLLATNGAQRSPQAPDAPAISELIPGFDFAPVIGLFARKGTPDAIVQRLATEVAAIVMQPEVIKQFTTAGIEAIGVGPDEYGKAMKAEIQRVNEVVKVAGIKPQ